MNEITIEIARSEMDNPTQPYLWYDDRGSDPGWVLRYSLSDRIGQRNLDEPLDSDLPEDAEDGELLALAETTARFVGILDEEIGNASL